MSIQPTKKIIVVALWCAFALIATKSVYGGEGTMVSGTPNQLNLNLYYTYTPADINVMKNAFQEASKLLYNSTNGQIRIGTVAVSTNSAFQNKADYWVNSGASGAYSVVGGFGTSGTHVTLFVDRHQWTNQDGPLGTEIGQFGIIHESGHYIFNLYDEYNTGSYPGACCVSTTSSIGCIMDGGTTVHPNHHRTEWCTIAGGGLTTSHVTTPNTPQQAIHGQSCWQELVNYCTSQYGITYTAPAVVDVSDPAGLGTISWITLGDRLRMILALDRSYSMSVDNKEPLAKQAASLFVDLCNTDISEQLGVVSFSNTAVSDYTMHNVTTIPDTKTDAINAINAIALENMTALGDGMRQSLNEITGSGTVPPDGSTEIIVLLSDGVHNYGSETPAAVIPDLRSRGVRVFTIGLGSASHPTYPLDESTLIDISNQTGATYTHALNAAQLPSIYSAYAADIRGMDTYPESTGEMASEGKSKEHKYFVDKYTKEITFILHWPFGPDALKLTLKNPVGKKIGLSTAGIEHVVKGNYIFYRIKKPKTGLWKMVVESNKSAKLEQKRTKYTTQVLALSPGLSCKVSPRKVNYKPGDAAIIRAFVYAAGVPVAKAQVTGVVRMPDGKLTEVQLYDDGNWKRHGDDKANDGVYSMRFLNTKSIGTYQVSLTINNVKGVTATPDEPDRKFRPKPIAQFVRASKSTFSIGRQEVKAPQNEKLK